MTSGKENEIILPPPSDRNPIPSLAAALRVDNQEQLLGLLLPPTTDNAASSSSSSKPQYLVFGTEALRTLLMRQVLSDPHQRHWPNAAKCNWDELHTFPVPRGLKLAGTAVLGTDDLEQKRTSIGTAGVDTVTYFLRPTDLAQTLRAAAFISQWKSPTTTHHRLVYLPQLPALIEKVLQDTGLTAPSSTKNVTVTSLQLDLFPLENDCISMEFPDCFRELEVEHTPSAAVSDVARSLLKLQDIVGRIPRLQAYGKSAEMVLKKTLDLAVQEYLANDGTDPESNSSNSNHSGDVAALVILDRKVDMVTPLVTPLTYEGLLDDCVGGGNGDGDGDGGGIDCGFVTVPVRTINPPDSSSNEGAAEPATTKQQQKPQQPNKEEMVALAVNNSDSIFAEIRNQHVEQFGSFLQNQARALKAVRNDFTETGKQKNLDELRKFVRNIPDLNKHFRLLGNHIHLAELVKKASESVAFRERWNLERAMMEGELCLDQLDDLVASQQYGDPYRFFRLLCLQSLCKNGISSSRYDSLRRDVVQTYGYEYLFVLQNLERAGLLRRKEAFLGMDKPSPFSKLKESLVLIHAEVDTVEPDDISYVSSGYAPLTVRLVQSAVSGWRNGRDDILRELPGRFLDITPVFPPEDLEATLQKPVSTGSTYGSLAPVAAMSGGGSGSSSSKRKPVLMVLYVGGVTYMELAALRFLSKRPSFPYAIICITTKIINGNTVLESLS